MRWPRCAERDDDGSAVVDFVLVVLVLVPLFLGILQLALVLHVRNTLTAAASDGARVAATADREPVDGAAHTRSQIDGALSERFARGVSARPTTIDGVEAVEVTVVAQVPALGLWGPAVRLEASGHAIEEQADEEP